MNTMLKITYIFLLLFCLNAQLLYGQQSCSDEIWSRYEKLVPTIKKLEKDKNFASVDSIYKEQITASWTNIVLVVTIMLIKFYKNTMVSCIIN